MQPLHESVCNVKSPTGQSWRSVQDGSVRLADPSIHELATRPKLKLSLFALYRPTRKNPADSKDFIGEKSIVVFLLVTTVHRITFYSIST